MINKDLWGKDGKFSNTGHRFLELLTPEKALWCLTARKGSNNAIL